MTLQRLMAVAILAVGTVRASESRGDLGIAVPVCMGWETAMSLTRAWGIASAMFTRIDVQLELRTGNDCSAGVIQISLSMSTPKSQLPRALAYALPYEGTHIVIFYDRVLQLQPRLVPTVTAHVMAHEIAHVLEGVNRHSKTGLMKAYWDEDDYSEMAWKPLPFAPEDVMLIRRGAHERAARRAGRGNGEVW